MDVIPGQAAQPAADPVAVISALLDAEKVVPDQPAQQPADDAQPEGEAEEVGENNAQVEGDDATAESAAVAEIPLDQLEAIELETTYKAEDGKDVTEKLPIKELRQGYMRTKDYQRKTAEVARQREELGNSVRQGIESERTQYLNTLQQLESALIEAAAPELKNVDWNHLANNDQFEYIRLSNRAKQVTDALNAIKTKQQEAATKADADRRQALTSAAQKTWATLESDIPGWTPELYQETLKAGEKLGFTSSEVASWVDARAIKLLHKAKLYDELQAAKPAANKKVVSVPKVVKPGAPTATTGKAQQHKAALDRLSKSGKLDDLTAVIASRL